VWFPIIALEVIYGGWNVGIHASQGDIENGWDAVKYFFAGAATGAVVGATWSVGLAGIASSSILARWEE
jgi:hypothetical protein